MKPVDRTYAGSDQALALVGSRLLPLFTGISELSGDARGKLYRAKGIADGRKVAIKVLTEETPVTKALLDSPQIENTLRVLDVMPAGDESFIVMEQPQGTPLSGLMSKHGRLSVSLALWVTLEILEILKTLHAQDKLHGSVNPGSVFISRSLRGNFRITMVYLGLCNESARRNDSEYLPPEARRSVSPHFDLWAAAVLLYKMLFAVHPFIGRSRRETSRRRLGNPVIPEEFSRKHPDLAAFLMRSLDKTPLVRYSSAEAMADALSEIAHPPRKSCPGEGEIREAGRTSSVPTLPAPPPEALIAESAKGIGASREAEASETGLTTPCDVPARLARREHATTSRPKIMRFFMVGILVTVVGGLFLGLWLILGSFGRRGDAAAHEPPPDLPAAARPSVSPAVIETVEEPPSDETPTREAAPTREGVPTADYPGAFKRRSERASSARPAKKRPPKSEQADAEKPKDNLSSNPFRLKDNPFPVGE